jgi:hypothetical protein
MYDDYLCDHCINHPKKDSRKALKWIRDITEEQLKEYTVWACVRNPYDRFNSVASMFGIGPNRFAREFDSLRGKKSIIKRHSEPQHLFTHFEGKQMAGVILRFENIQSDFNFICDTIGLERHSLKRINRSNHGNWYETFNRETIDFVNRYYALDFAYFNYWMI